MNTNPSQAQKVLKRLRKRSGRWVSMIALWKASGSFAVHSRASELRKRGHEIKNEVRHRGRKALSFYRLIEKREVAHV